jgi:hypothetical protein
VGVVGRKSKGRALAMGVAGAFRVLGTAPDLHGGVASAVPPVSDGGVSDVVRPGRGRLSRYDRSR